MISAKNSTAKLEVLPAEKSAYNTVFFDVGDVLLSTSKAAQRRLFVPVILKNPSLCYHLMRCDTKSLYFEILQDMPAQSEQPIYNKNIRLPLIMADWMNGYKSPTVLRISAHEHIQKTDLPQSVKRLLLAIANFMFDPRALIETQEVCVPMVKLMQMLRAQNYKVYLLSNWDPTSFEIAQEKFPEIFDSVDGMIISGKEQVSKPDLNFFKLALNRFDVDPSTTIFIDDEPHNIDAAQHIGLRTIIHTSPKDTFKELMRCGILTLVP